MGGFPLVSLTEEINNKKDESLCFGVCVCVFFRGILEKASANRSYELVKREFPSQTGSSHGINMSRVFAVWSRSGALNMVEHRLLVPARVIYIYIYNNNTTFWPVVKGA